MSEPIPVRPYRESDHPACRSLWAELTEYHRQIYGDPTVGGDDPGSGFEDYLAEPKRVGLWVAEIDDRIAGLTGLFDHGEQAEIEPVVVTADLRGRGIGTALVRRVVEEASSRGNQYLTVRPVARNTAAIGAFHAVGFHALGGHVDLTMDLAPRRHKWLSGASLHGLDFDY